MHNNRIVILENALVKEKAENLYAELAASKAWEHELIENHVGEPNYFRYSRDHITFDTGNEPPALLEFREYLRSKECLDLIAYLSGLTCGWFEGGAACLNAGDSIDWHNDRNVDPARQRSITFNCYLTKGWQESWGGEFLFKDPAVTIPPAFNTIALFPLTKRSHHKVNMIDDSATQGRYAISGWFLLHSPRPR